MKRRIIDIGENRQIAPLALVADRPEPRRISSPFVVRRDQSRREHALFSVPSEPSCFSQLARSALPDQPDAAPVSLSNLQARGLIPSARATQRARESRDNRQFSQVRHVLPMSIRAPVCEKMALHCDLAVRTPLEAARLRRRKLGPTGELRPARSARERQNGALRPSEKAPILAAFRQFFGHFLREPAHQGAITIPKSDPLEPRPINNVRAAILNRSPSLPAAGLPWIQRIPQNPHCRRQR
jgi:hypothetical protein